MRKKAFTLIELITVIAILSILAVLIIPRFSNLQTQAIEKQEEAVWTALKEAVNHEHMLNVTQGNDVWPTVNPFTLLSNSPPYLGWNIDPLIQPDGKNWRYWYDAELWYLCCPHYSNYVPLVNRRGRAFVYSTLNGSWTIYDAVYPH